MVYSHSGAATRLSLAGESLLPTGDHCVTRGAKSFFLLASERVKDEEARVAGMCARPDTEAAI